MKTPITYYGGKQYLSKFIVGMMPKHDIYVEPYFGGGAVFFTKGPSHLEVINDSNNVLMTFYETCQSEEKFAQLQMLIKSTLHSEAAYRKAYDIYHHPERYGYVDIAWAVWMVTNISFTGSPQGGWKWDNGTSGSHSGVVMNNYRSAFTKKIFERLRYVQISSRDAITVIRQRDSENTFFYLDPPYPDTVQKHYRGFTFDSLNELLTLLHSIKGRFLLSNYPSKVLMKYIKDNGWNVKQIDISSRVSNFQGEAKRKPEVLVYNYTLEPQLFEIV